MMLSRQRPLQSARRKSKSLNGLQMDSPAGGDIAGPVDSPATAKIHHRGAPHARLERQSSRGLTGRKAQGGVSTPPNLEVEGEEPPRDHHQAAPSPIMHSSQASIAMLQLASSEPWVEEARWRRGSGENAPSFFAERSRKQDQKGGFRSSFRKLFKKKSGGEVKDRANEPQADTHHEPAKAPPTAQLGQMDRGTAV
ncbi:hypothetical protein AAFF_G00255710 [Aldrovandia affinis]|uniref:Uncharacterized protein n=1 Tax=Aldrovandia affinis TaxID=143900 RepID=A0AAD7RCW4_9TELE|nr:hypothetical protein AAFF_G00255710 [Aldrovandia affinis]